LPEESVRKQEFLQQKARRCIEMMIEFNRHHNHIIINDRPSSNKELMEVKEALMTKQTSFHMQKAKPKR
jgi:hypothetical protein